MKPCSRCIYSALCLPGLFDQALIALVTRLPDPPASYDTAAIDRHIGIVLGQMLDKRPEDCPNRRT